MAAALPFVAIGLTLLGSLQQAGAAQQQAQSQAQASLYNAQMAQRNAAVARQQASADADRQSKDSQRRIGTAIAQYGAMGSFNGQALDVLADSAAQAETDRQTILYKGEIRAMGYDADAALGRFSAETATERGDTQAGNALLGGVGRVIPMLPGYSIGTTGGSPSRTVGGGTAP